MNKKQVVDLIAALKKSERAKAACGKRLIAYYEKLKKDLR
jgi:hypothetical protein